MIDLGLWIPNTEKRNYKPRWVLAVNNGHVIYGTGDRLHRECKVKTFERWIGYAKAERQSQR